MEKWYVTAKKADFEAIAEEFHIDTVVARILRNRDLVEKEDIRRFLYGTKKDMYDAFLLKDVKKGAEYIAECIEKKTPIRVIGDYDVDGVCATHILSMGLKVLGAKVDTAIPHRIRDGYGLNEQLISEAKEAGIEVILTCDNGISAAKQIEYAGQLGMTVIVTDHHEVPQDGLPKAYAVIDPKQKDCKYPYPNICGALVAYKFIEALFSVLHKEEIFEEQIWEELLSIAAVATVCDVMELQDENRIVVKEGLHILQKKPNLGLAALMEVCGLEKDKLSGFHLGFVIGPCINATGRLDTPKRALELLQCRERKEAVEIAQELKELNDSRKTMTTHGVERAMNWLEQGDRKKEKVLVVFLEDCHESLAGIIAGRIREAFMKPAFVLTKTEDGLVKGSGRSIEAYDMYAAMTQCKDCFLKFGGHKLAAGLSMEEEKVDEFRRRMNENCKLSDEDFIEKVHIDVPMPTDYAGLSLAKQLSLLEPFGVGNEKPLFAEKGLKLISGKQMGVSKRAAKFCVEEANGKKQEILYFGDLEKIHNFLREKYGEEAVDKLYQGKTDNYEISITYQLGINSFRGREDAQIVIKHFC